MIIPLDIARRLFLEWSTTYDLRPTAAGRRPFSYTDDPARLGGRLVWLEPSQCVLLAAHGFLAFPFGYSQGGNVWNAGSIHEVSLDRSAAALEALRGFDVSSGRVGLYGVSRGAEHALLLTSLMARDGVPGIADAVAAHSPPDCICGAFDGRIFRDVGDPGWQAWDGTQRAWNWRGSSEALLPTQPIEI